MPKRHLTSEVGSHPQSTPMEVMWREFFVQQNNNMVDVIRSLRSNDVNTRKVVLPKFNPDVSESDAASWCATADVIMSDRPQEGSELIMTLSAAFCGDASQWLTQVCFPDINWNQFKELFLQRFDNKETSAAEVMKLLNSLPKPGECLMSFGNRLVTTLETKWKIKSVQEIAVSVVLASLTHLDSRLQRLAYTTEIKTRAELQHELMAFSYKSDRGEMADDFMPKKFKPNTPIKCHFCGKLGHKLIECRARKHQDIKKISAQSSTP